MMNKWMVTAALTSALSALAFAQPTTKLNLTAPIKTWDEAIPLGNGFMGGLLWGEGNLIRLTIDRGDLWDLRPAPELSDPGWNYANLQKLVAEKNQREISRLFDACYEQHPYPTKLPVGRLEVRLPEGMNAESFELDMLKAEGYVKLGEKHLRAFFDANSRVAMLRIPSAEATFELIPPSGMSKLGYDPAPVIRDQNMIRFNQRAANGMMFSIVVVWRVVADETFAAVSVFTNREDGAFGALAPFRLRDSLDQGYDKLFKLHADWWTKFWSPSSVTIPDEKAQQHYNLVKYFYGAASRRGAPPMPLQGVWTADNGDLPPWKGDYHNDLNTQTTYIAYQTAGLFESGMSWIEFNNKLMPRYRKFAQEFYGLKGGIVVPGVMTLDGSPMGGWGMYSLSPTNGAWIAHNFIRHWRTRDDDDELKKTIYPFCREIGFGIAGLLKPTADGKLRLPLSSSPEIHDNSLRAWLKPNSNYDLALMKELFSSLAEMASKVNQIGEASFWYDKLDRLEDFTTDETGLIFSEGEPVKGSHRHFSHLMAIHPLDVLDLDNSKDRELAQKSVDHMLKQGTDWWTGYSFSWMACMLAKMGDGERANEHLEKYLKGFILRNGFHCNGDQSGTGLSKMTYRPFTLEGNFLAMEAVHLMLLKSNKRGIEVFPAVPKKWDNASFVDLRAEGGFKVSARRAGRSTISVKVVATTDSVVRLKDPFGGEGRAIWTGQGFRREGASIIAILRAGQGIRGELR